MSESGCIYLEVAPFDIATGMGGVGPVHDRPTRNRRKAKQRLGAAMRFAVAASDDAGAVSLTLFAGRRSLTQDLSAAEAELLVQLLSR
ncbi:hypothetical protein ACSFBI_25960 [Variovorax sp. RB3P1]|uniref:hypothetical protein n=1 Tax=Variovorax sp. RB3P1 TaxID=3443732 RepID=UPI003F447877